MFVTFFVDCHVRYYGKIKSSVLAPLWITWNNSYSFVGNYFSKNMVKKYSLEHSIVRFGKSVKSVEFWRFLWNFQKDCPTIRGR